MAEVFNKFRPGFKLVTANLDWNFQMPFLRTHDTKTTKGIRSRFFSSQDPQETGDKWQLELHDENKKFRINVFLSNEVNGMPILEPIKVKIAIFNSQRIEIFKEAMVTTRPYERNDKNPIVFVFEKETRKSPKARKSTGSFPQVPVIRCKIYWHKNRTYTSSAHSSITEMDCSYKLSDQLKKLFEKMQFSDVVFNVDGREFPAHKSILSVRCEVLAAMFQDPTKENSTNHVKIEDIEPEVFQELLRFIYTGRLNSLTMETMAAKLFIAAEKYVFKELREECKNYLVLQMSPVNCAELILHGDLLNPAEYMAYLLKEAAQCFRLIASEVMATSKWEQMEKENPQLLLKVLKILLSKKVK